MSFGYHGCYLRIDVTSAQVERVPLPETVRRQYIGGSGLGARLLLDEGGADSRVHVETALNDVLRLGRATGWSACPPRGHVRVTPLGPSDLVGS